MRTMKHLMLATAAAAALALAGCGGGGGSPQSTAPQPMPVNTAGIAGMVQAGSYTIAAGQSATHGDVTYSCPAGGADCMVDVMADGMTTSTGGMATAMNSAGYNERVALTTQINALRTQLGLGGEADVGSSVSDLQQQVADLTKRVNDAQTAADKAAMIAMTAKGKTIFKVLDSDLGADGTPTARAIVPARENAAAARVPAVSATYGQAAKLSTTNQAAFVNGSLTTAATDNTAFTSAQAGTSVSLSANNGFSGTMLTWSSPTKADTMTVYTDIAAPRSVLFSEEHGGGTQVLDPQDTTHTGVTGAAFTGRTAGDVQHSPNAKLATTDTTNNLVRLPGSYMGAVGAYSCTPAAGVGCITRVTSTGVIFVDADATTGWMFTANDGAMVSVADPSHMTYGWWMRDVKTTSDILDNVAVFYDAPHPDDLAVGALTGKANYEGGAAGKYAWRDRVADTAHGGHFTASASLSANFGTEMLSGSISDFRIGDDGTDPNWTVTLSAATITDAGGVARTGADAANVTWAVGSSKANAAGSWEAQLSNSGASRNDNLPTGVAGAFNTSFNEQGRMIGAFGANITNPNPPKN